MAGAGFLLAFLCSVAGWRAALVAAGGRICPLQAAARIGVGSMVNSFAPAKLGDAVKVALCARAIEGPRRLWTAGGVYVALAAARSLTLAALVVAASATGAIPLWPVFVLCGTAALVACAAMLSERLRNHPRIGHTLGALRTVERSPRAICEILGWTAGMVLARLGATAAIAAAFGLPHPLLAALLILPALDVAAAFPLTPGSLGIGSGAVAVALASRGIGMTQALGVGLAIQALETLVSVSVGTLGGVFLLQPSPAVRRFALRAVTVGVAVGGAAFLGVALDLL